MHEKIKIAIIIVGFAFLIANFLQFYAFDDLSFDYVGYAMRAYNALNGGWNSNHYLGYPASVFTPQLPSILPIFFKAMGFGSITLPVSISILVMRILVILAFAFAFAKIVRTSYVNSLLFGIVFMLNPFMFNYLNRYYELTAWFFFIVFFFFAFKLLEQEKKNYLFPAIFSLAAILLSSQIPASFAAILSLLFLGSFKNAKKLAIVWIAAAGLCLFWLGPFLLYSQYSELFHAGSHGLQNLKTTGIIASDFFLAAALGFSLFVCVSRKHFPNKGFSKKLLSVLFLLSLLIIPMTFTGVSVPIFSGIFAHSYHVFFVFALLFFWASYFTVQKPSKKAIIAIALVAIALIAVPQSGKIIARQYANETPLFSSPDYFEGGVSLEEIEGMVNGISKNERMQIIPNDNALTAFFAIKYDSKFLTGWGEDIYVINGAFEFNKKLEGVESCEQIKNLAYSTGTKHWIVFEQSKINLFEGCRIPLAGKSASGKVAHFVLPASIIENAELVSLENLRIEANAEKGKVLLHVPFFPRWKAFLDGKEVPIQNNGLSMAVETQEAGKLVFAYALLPVDLLFSAVSIVSAIAIFFAAVFLRKTPKH